MFKLIRGNEDNLEGRASIYTHNLQSSNSEVPKYPAIYVATSPLDLFLEEEFSSERYELEKGWEKHLNEFDKVTKKLNLKGIVPSVARPLQISSPEELREYSGDIIYAGRTSQIEISLPALFFTSTLYMLNYGAQLLDRMNRTQYVKNNVEVPVECFKDYNKDTLTSRLYELTGQFFFAKDRKDDLTQERIRKQFIQLANGANFAPQIANIIQALTLENPKMNEYITLQARLAGCLHGEDFREASRLKKEIQDIKID